jgi:hypothetical protein
MDWQGDRTPISDWVKRKIQQQQILISVKTFGAHSFIPVVVHHPKDGPALSGWTAVGPPEV